MEKHFESVLGKGHHLPQEDYGNASFLPAKTFSGPRADFVFRNGNEGIGYYRDTTKPNKYLISVSLFYYFGLPYLTSVLQQKDSGKRKFEDKPGNSEDVDRRGK
jgi:hypothetical protein